MLVTGWFVACPAGEGVEDAVVAAGGVLVGMVVAGGVVLALFAPVGGGGDAGVLVPVVAGLGLCCGAAGCCGLLLTPTLGRGENTEPLSSHVPETVCTAPPLMYRQ